MKQRYLSNNEIPDGKIDVDSSFAVKIGFTSENGFNKDSYIWGYPFYNGLMLSLIICNKRGGFKNLMQNIIDRGYLFRIPAPSNRILEIAKKQNWNLGHDGKCFFVTNEEIFK